MKRRAVGSKTAFRSLIRRWGEAGFSKALDKVFGISQGCAYSIRYAVENPGRVTCLVFLGGYLRGRLKQPGPEAKNLFETLTMTIRDGWGSPNPVFRHFFTSNFMPDAPPEIAASFDEHQRIATSPENAQRLWDLNAQLEATELAKKVRVPTVVLHCEGDRIAPLDEGRLMARLIPGASFVELPGNNHMPLAGTTAFDQFFEEATSFLAMHNR